MNYYAHILFVLVSQWWHSGLINITNSSRKNHKRYKSESHRKFIHCCVYTHSVWPQRTIKMDLIDLHVYWLRAVTLRFRVQLKAEKGIVTTAWSKEKYKLLKLTPRTERNITTKLTQRTERNINYWSDTKNRNINY